MFPIKPEHNPTLSEALFFFIIIIGLISYFIVGLDTVPHIPILLGIILLVAYGLIKKIPFESLETGMIAGAKSGMGAIFFFFLIGIFISRWMVSVTIHVLLINVFD